MVHELVAAHRIPVAVPWPWSCRGVRRLLLASPTTEYEARRLLERLAVCWGVSLCLRHETMLADTHGRSRLDGDWESELGTLVSGADLGGLIRRAVPVHD